MQVNLNCNCPKPQQSFGMAIHSTPSVNKIIKSRVKNVKQLKRIEDIFEKAKRNKLVDVSLFPNPDGKTICANIYSTNTKINLFKSRSENFITKLFGGDIEGFIRGCSKTADKMEVKAANAGKILNNKTF